MAKSNPEQTKGKIKLIGKVVGIANDNARKEGFTKSDKKYQSLTFFLETSSINRNRLELFGQERDEVVAYSQKAKESKKIKWADRKKNFGDYKVMGIGCYLVKENETDDKYMRVILPEYDAVDYIKNNLKDGDIVRINGEIDFQKYENKQGNMVLGKRLNIKSITKLDDALDFKSADFKEESKFEHDIVVNDIMMDDEAKKLIVNAKIIKYGGEVVDAEFKVDAEKYPKLVNNMVKRFGFGDFVKVFGLVINAAILKEGDQVEQVELSDDDDWGGDEEIAKSFENNYSKEYVQELQITSVDSSSYEPKKYKEEDLLSEDEDAFNGDVKGDNPAGSESFDDDMDELPFE